jgi:branched-chain amino acid transport system permease protein
MTQQLKEPSAFMVRFLHAYRSRSTSPQRPPVYDQHQYVKIALFLAAAAIIGPAIGSTSPSRQFNVDLWVVYSITAIGFYWVFSLAGKFAFCQVFMMSVGGYTSAWVIHGGEWPFVAGVAAAVAVTALIALVVGLLLGSAPHLFFALGTLALTEIGAVVFTQWTAFAGPGGTVVGIPPASIFGYTFFTDIQMFWLMLLVLGLVLLLGAWIDRSPVRRFAIAGRDNPMVAVLLGVPVARTELGLFTLGSALGGLSGALVASWTGSVSSDSFGFSLAIGVFLMLILGGAKTIWGPVVGAAFYVVAPNLLAGFTSLEPLIYGGLLLIVIVALPDGLVGLGATAVRAVIPWMTRMRVSVRGPKC